MNVEGHSIRNQSATSGESSANVSEDNECDRSLAVLGYRFKSVMSLHTIHNKNEDIMLDLNSSAINPYISLNIQDNLNF